MSEELTDKKERFNYTLPIVDPQNIEPKRRMTINASNAANAVAYVRKTWPTTQSVLVLDKRSVR